MLFQKHWNLTMGCWQSRARHNQALEETRRNILLLECEKTRLYHRVHSLESRIQSLTISESDVDEYIRSYNLPWLEDHVEKEWLLKFVNFVQSKKS